MITIRQLTPLDVDAFSRGFVSSGVEPKALKIKKQDSDTASYFDEEQMVLFL